MKRIVDTAALVAVADEIEHNCNMLGYVDEDSVDDVGFYVPRIQRAVDALRGIIRKSEPVKGVEHEQKISGGSCGTDNGTGQG